MAALPRKVGEVMTISANAVDVGTLSRSTHKCYTNNDDNHAEPLSPSEIFFEEMLRGERNQGKL